MTDFIMPFDKNIFIPQTIFSVQGVPVLFGTLKSGQLKNGMVMTIVEKKLRIIKLEQGIANLGISLSDIDITQAQNLINKELEFFEIK
ncbi:MAG: hypothetical protein WC895_02820 [Candidatus Shapirobacteria bacterium]